MVAIPIHDCDSDALLIVFAVAPEAAHGPEQQAPVQEEQDCAPCIWRPPLPCRRSREVSMEGLKADDARQYHHYHGASVGLGWV